MPDTGIRIASIGKLERMEAMIMASAGEERTMGPVLHHAAAIEDENLVGVGDRR